MLRTVHALLAALTGFWDGLIPTVERTSRYSVRFQSEEYLNAYQLIRVLYRNLSE